MRIGILADLHEEVEHLAAALDRLRAEGVDAIVTLGDVVEMGRRGEETIALLAGAGVVGVWGNHDFGLCVDPDDWLRERFGPRVMAYMATLQPRLSLGGCLFSHVDPCHDPRDVGSFYLHHARPPEDLARLADCTGMFAEARIFIGHYHAWRAVDESGPLDWYGSVPFQFEPGRRSLMTVAGLSEGHFALMDTEADVLTPLAVGVGP